MGVKARKFLKPRLVTQETQKPAQDEGGASVPLKKAGVVCFEGSLYIQHDLGPPNHWRLSHHHRRAKGTLGSGLPRWVDY